MINYVKGDLFKFIEDKSHICIPHVTNNQNAWGSGFVVPLGQIFPKAKQHYHQHVHHRCLGSVGFVEVKRNVWVANMCSQILGGERPLNYGSLVACMKKVGVFCVHNNLDIVAPKFGSALAGGNWLFIEDLIEDIWLERDINVTVCEYRKLWSEI